MVEVIGLHQKGKPRPEVQDIFRTHGESYRQTHNLPVHILKAMSAIEACRTKALGGHVERCNDCGHTRNAYNSCKNRHCPKCQSLEKEKWIYNQQENLLNVRYFHVVFTIPDTLNTPAFQNQKVLYDILFKAVSETLAELCGDKKYLGASVGFTSILHTWGQNLMHHPHIHCVIPGGGIGTNKWISSRKKFFIPVKVLSRKFRGKFLFHLKQAFTEKQISFFGEFDRLKDDKVFNKFLTLLYQKEWIVYCKPPFGNANQVMSYLGRYA
jgi:predicted Zn-ribbon and HTH transcriptional regulator